MTDPTSLSTSSAPPSPLFEGPPTVTMPVVPAGFTLTKLRRLLTFRLTHLGLSAMPQIATDLEADGASETLGASGPYPKTVAAQIRAALAWRALRNASEAWAEYVRTCDLTAWQRVMTLLSDVWARYDAAVALDPTLVHKMPGLASFDRAQRAPSRAAAAARKRNRKAKAEVPEPGGHPED
jgi:hypothetical protein